MTQTQRKAILNRPLFTQRSFDSAGLTVLTTLLHRFAEPGGHQVTVRRDGSVARRITVDVLSDGGQRQVNLDLSESPDDGGCGCGRDGVLKLAAGGFVGLYPSRGTGRYAVTVNRPGSEKKQKRIELDCADEIPAGDAFAVTLVRPGRYRVTTSNAKVDGEIRVRVPRDVEGYRPDKAVSVEVGEKGLALDDRLDLYSGQSVVFQLQVPARIRVQLVEEDSDAGPPVGRGRRTVSGT